MSGITSIVGISDVSVGYGSPQIPKLMQSLADEYGADSLIIEPDRTGTTPVTQISDNCKIHRIALPESPYSDNGQFLYNYNATREVDRLKPDILVIFCAYNIPVLLRLKHKPKFIIYTSIESIHAYGEESIKIHKLVRDRIDLLIFPEANRAILDIPRCDLQNIPLAIVYNTANSSDLSEMVPPNQRVDRMLYTGTIHSENTFPHYLLNEQVNGIPIDIYGSITGPDAESLRTQFMEGSTGEVKYNGYIASERLAALRKEYAYSIVLWAPINENQRYAAPNKFFEAIADGVPPIVGPHPQCRLLAERYDCAIVMPDWSLDGFVGSLKEAVDVFGTNRYEDLVRNCRTAAREELNWDVQFGKVQRLLPSAF